MFASAFAVGLMAAIFVALPAAVALYAARMPESLARWPAGWVVRRRVHRADAGVAYRAMPIQSLERRRVVPAGLPRLPAAVAGLCAMLAFVWGIALAFALRELGAAAVQGVFASPLVASSAFCAARACAGFALVAAVFARRPRRVVTSALVALALDLVLHRGLPVSDSRTDDAAVAALGLVLTGAMALSFAYCHARRRGLQRGEVLGVDRESTKGIMVDGQSATEPRTIDEHAGLHVGDATLPRRMRP